MPTTPQGCFWEEVRMRELQLHCRREQLFPQARLPYPKIEVVVEGRVRRGDKPRSPWTAALRTTKILYGGYGFTTKRRSHCREFLGRYITAEQAQAAINEAVGSELAAKAGFSGRRG